ncbi:ZIP zinc transporter-domain-containing protein [Mucor mucedo]|uniref:ZIP zinc transporter-domain-containing protein n=1 Tax=Mucor mucedo TaxID=29922 RepID=UPI00221EA835|nr:ZIP zinc transporter-domain-containing protein [Mucor mucedo]KAI7887252.1 ZIP zinc transporter-domain-containing protein [Mucor mucedo]
MTKFFVTRGLFLLLIGAFLFSAVWAQEDSTTDISHSDMHIHEDGTVHSHDDETHSHEHTENGVSSGSSHGHSHGSQSCEVEDISDYNMPFRIGSIFIILATSAVGIFSPIVLYRISSFKDGSIRDWVLTAGKFFGTGVIIATAFIHMLPEAIERFGSDCLGEGWHSYHAFGGLFCMLASFSLQIIELAAISNLDAIARRNIAATGHIDVEKSSTYQKEISEKVNTHSHHEHDHNGISQDGHVHSAGFLENDQSLRSVSTFILELGIIMHSIIIGLTLGTADSTSFQTLLIALCFHQFFEGIALGTRVNDLQYKSWKKPIIMGIIFVCMTPIGIGIGIGIKSTMNPPSSILAQAILDSLSAGILLYSAYISLMSIEINHNIGFRKSSLPRKVFCFLCMYLGAALMSVIGIWA